MRMAFTLIVVLFRKILLSEELSFPGSSWRGRSSRKIYALAVSLTTFLSTDLYPGNSCQTHEERAVCFEGKHL